MPNNQSTKPPTQARTRGPWEIRRAWADDEKFEVYPTFDRPPEFGQWAEIATVGGSNRAQARKNAKLIAAAPDLLDALKGALRVADRATAEFDAARKAIAKAEATSDEY